MSFSKQVNDFAIGFEDATEETIRGTAIALFRGIIVSSPVDEGTFRSNWFVSGAIPSTQKNESRAVSEGSAIQEMTNKVIGLQNWKSITFTNNLPYSEVIEFGGYPTGNIREPSSKVTFQGFSKQAPKGVLRTNVKRFNALIEREAAKNGF